MKVSFIVNVLILTINSSILAPVESRCSKGCDLALVSYRVWFGTNLSFISQVTNTPIPEILDYNKQIPNEDSIQQGSRINVPCSCDCLNNGELGHIFTYNATSDTQEAYDKIAGYYSNLTTNERVQQYTVRCYCGDKNIDKRYGLFITYPLTNEDGGESLDSIAASNNLSTDVIKAYNPDTNFSAGSGQIFIPGKDKDGNYRPLNVSRTGLRFGAIAGIAIAGLLLFSVCLYFGWYKKKAMKMSLLSRKLKDQSNQLIHDARVEGGLAVKKSIEFTYEELSKATDNFSIANKIGQGGFGVVYYAELRGEKAAIKRMNMQATREFRAELNILTHVHHLNLVRLIGYSVEGSLFLVYEYIENGNLREHLCGSGNNPLSWPTRFQIAQDSARGLEYIHEQAVHVYIHRDIKSENILIDKDFHGKIADFGLTKLTQVGSNSLPTRLVGTFGYMPPEYARFGRITPKVDVYAFGVVLYELISAKEAIVTTNDFTMEVKELVALFEEVMSQTDSKEGLRRLVDPVLGNNYPLDSVFKMAQLAKACTHKDPQLRPSMRSVVVALRTISSTTEDWDVASLYGNQGSMNLMFGR